MFQSLIFEQRVLVSLFFLMGVRSGRGGGGGEGQCTLGRGVSSKLLNFDQISLPLSCVRHEFNNNYKN